MAKNVPHLFKTIAQLNNPTHPCPFGTSPLDRGDESIQHRPYTHLSHFTCRFHFFRTLLTTEVPLFGKGRGYRSTYFELATSSLRASHFPLSTFSAIRHRVSSIQHRKFFAPSSPLSRHVLSPSASLRINSAEVGLLVGAQRRFPYTQHGEVWVLPSIKRGQGMCLSFLSS